MSGLKLFGGKGQMAWLALGGTTLLGAWWLSRRPGRVAVPKPPLAGVSRLGVVFGKPLGRAVVSGGWGDPRPKRVGSFHYAIDLPSKLGTPIHAVTSGTIIWADSVGKTTAGKYVVLKHDGVRTRYLHMSRVAVKAGQQVARGDVIGLVGSTGFSSGPHLHLDVFLSDRLLAVYRERFGEPTPPFPRKRTWGTQVPAEALVPVDHYSKRVLATAVRRRVRLLVKQA